MADTCAHPDHDDARFTAVACPGCQADEYPPQVEYPEDHSPFCPSDCDHEVHRPYDEWKARQGGR